MYEHIVDYKQRVDACLDALTASGNAVPDAEDTAMDSCMAWIIIGILILRQSL
jgi:hypothetical protein